MSSIDSLSRRQFLGLAGVTVAGLGLAGCSASGSDTTSDGSSSSDAGSDDSSSTASLSGSITAVGSTALQPLVEAAAEQFMEENPDVQISVQGGGSGQGITQIAEGAIQIGNSDVFAEEKLDNPDDADSLIDNKVCIVGMGPVVCSDVTIDDISMDDLAGIFTGQITNWSEVGGDDMDITVINRASGSGTRATFESNVLGDTEVPADFTPQEQDSSGTVATMIAGTPGSISYLAFSYYGDDFKALSVDGVEPTEDNVETNAWTIWAYEHMYTTSDPDDATQAFIDYMLSDDVQGSLVESLGYIPITGMQVEKDADGNVTEL